MFPGLIYYNIWSARWLHGTKQHCNTNLRSLFGGWGKKTHLVNLLLEFCLDFAKVTDFLLFFLKLILEFLTNEKFTKGYQRAVHQCETSRDLITGHHRATYPVNERFRPFTDETSCLQSTIVNVRNAYPQTKSLVVDNRCIKVYQRRSYDVIFFLEE